MSLLTETWIRTNVPTVVSPVLLPLRYYAISILYLRILLLLMDTKYATKSATNTDRGPMDITGRAWMDGVHRLLTDIAPRCIKIFKSNIKYSGIAQW